MDKVVPCICVGLIFIVAPMLKQPSVAMSKNVKGVVNTEFTITVDDVVVSNSGIRNCKMTIVDISTSVIGPCATTDGTKLAVGNTYKVSRAKIDKGFIVVNAAKDMGGPLRWEVVDTYVTARTPLMKIKNGDKEKVVGNNSNYAVGSFVTGY